MVADEELGWLLRVLSSSVRRSVLRGLAKEPGKYSQLTRSTRLEGLNSGVFNFHLSRLSELGVVSKSDDLYELTWKGRIAARFLERIEAGFDEIVGGRSLKTDGIREKPWIQVKCQTEWAAQHAGREPIATLGMTLMYLSGIQEILSYPHGLEIGDVKRMMTNLKQVAEKEKEPKVYTLALKLAEIRDGTIAEFESCHQGTLEAIEYVASSPRWFELLPERIPADEGRNIINEWRQWAADAKTTAREGRIIDGLYVTKLTAFGILGIYAEGIPQKTGKWRNTWLDTLIEIGQVDPAIGTSYMKAMGLKEYTIADSIQLLTAMNEHLDISRQIIARHGIEDLTRTDI